jgi:hypothetical protein
MFLFERRDVHIQRAGYEHDAGEVIYSNLAGSKTSSLALFWVIKPLSPVTHLVTSMSSKPKIYLLETEP